MKTYATAIKRMPACCASAVEACESDRSIAPIQNLIDGVRHELDLYQEGEENISLSEANECARFLEWIKR